MAMMVIYSSIMAFVAGFLRGKIIAALASL